VRRLQSRERLGLSPEGTWVEDRRSDGGANATTSVPKGLGCTITPDSFSFGGVRRGVSEGRRTGGRSVEETHPAECGKSRWVGNRLD